MAKKNKKKRFQKGHKKINKYAFGEKPK